jgi:ribosomal protein S18 acetylase RimI-like enzyme
MRYITSVRYTPGFFCEPPPKTGNITVVNESCIIRCSRTLKNYQLRLEINGELAAYLKATEGHKPQQKMGLLNNFPKTKIKIEPDCVELQTLEVHPKFQRIGLGRHMVRLFMEHFKHYQLILIAHPLRWTIVEGNRLNEKKFLNDQKNLVGFYKKLLPKAKIISGHQQKWIVAKITKTSKK